MNQPPLLGILAVVSAALICSGLLVLLVPFLRRQLLDQPNARSSHRQPTPRGGGVAFVLVAAVASVIALVAATSSELPSLAKGQMEMLSLPLVTLPLAVMGLLDDWRNLPASWRYAVQLLTAPLLILLSPLSLPWIALPLLYIAVTGVINFSNFMDGLDGLVGGCMAVIIAALALELGSPWPIWALVGALLGFLFWNWSPAQVFMGDVGSTFLGAVFAGLVLQAPGWPEALRLLMVATPLLGDACLCVLRRLLAGQHVFQAHRLHLFQRLHQAGWASSRVSSLYIAATALLSLALIAGGWPWVVSLAAAELLIGAWLDQRVAIPFAVASRR